MELSLTTYFLLAVSIISLVLWKCKRKTDMGHISRVLPEPFSLPFFGHALFMDLRNLHLTFAKYAEKYGRIFQVKIFGQTVVVLNDHKLVRKAFANDYYGDVFNDRPASFVGKYVGFGYRNISFGQCDKRTLTLRKMLHKGLKVFGEGVTEFEQHVQDELTRLVNEIHALRGEDFCLGQVLKKSFGNWMASLLTGREATENDSTIIWNLLDAINAIMAPDMTFISETFPFMRNCPGKLGRLYKASITARNIALRRFVAHSNMKTQDNDDNNSLVKVLVGYQKVENEKAGYELIDGVYLLGLVQDIIFAGTETTTTALINGFSLLLQYPKYASKIQHEIDQVVGHSRTPSLDDRKSMPFTKAFLLELLRYTSQVPTGVPHRARGDQDFEGYTIKKDSVLFSNIWFIHHDPNIWKDPWNFRPDRFIGPDGQLLSPEHELRLSLVTFSFGRRACPGETLAMTRMFLYITRILQVFDICPPSTGRIPNTDPRSYNPGLNLRVKDYLCKVLPRLNYT